MATTTPNYGWTVPTSGDLVKDGATAIETLGDAIDASMNTALGTKKSGMVLLSSVAFSGVSSQSVNDVFSATYQNYLVQVTTGDPATNQLFTMRLRVSGADNSTSNYYRMNFGQGTGGSTSLLGATQTSFGLGYAGTGSFYSASFDVFNPFDSGLRTSISGGAIGNNSSYNGITGWTLSNWFDATTSFTGFTLLFGANTTGTISVYGANK
jgi:hypothetical protein